MDGAAAVHGEQLVDRTALQGAGLVQAKASSGYRVGFNHKALGIHNHGFQRQVLKQAFVLLCGGFGLQLRSLEVLVLDLEFGLVHPQLFHQPHGIEHFLRQRLLRLRAVFQQRRGTGTQQFEFSVQ